MRYAPEFACIPFKILMGTYIEVAAWGPAVITSGHWPLPGRVLLGDAPVLVGGNGVAHEGYCHGNALIKPGRFLGQDKPPAPQRWISLKELLRILRITWEKIKAIDDIEVRSHQVRPLEIKRGDTTRAINEGLAFIDQAQHEQEIAEARQEAPGFAGQGPARITAASL